MDGRESTCRPVDVSTRRITSLSMSRACPIQTRQTDDLERESAEQGARRVDPRAPARALAALVRQDGLEAPKAVYRAFEDHNREHFGAELGQSMILLTHPSSPRTLGDYVPKDQHGIPSRIRIAPKCERFGLLYVLDVLLHEMVHAWQYEVIEDLEVGYEGHGPLFARKCNEIGAKLELGEVAPKGRGGKPKAAHWPICVRPPGYYGPNDPRSGPPEGNEKGERAGEGASSERPRTGVVIDGLGLDDVRFLEVLGEVAGEDVATTVRRLAVGEAKRIAGEGGKVGELVREALASYEHGLGS